jgi:hypothetical protein
VGGEWERRMKREKEREEQMKRAAKCSKLNSVFLPSAVSKFLMEFYLVLLFTIIN